MSDRTDLIKLIGKNIRIKRSDKSKFDAAIIDVGERYVFFQYVSSTSGLQMMSLADVAQVEYQFPTVIQGPFAISTPLAADTPLLPPLPLKTESKESGV